MKRLVLALAFVIGTVVPVAASSAPAVALTPYCTQQINYPAYTVNGVTFYAWLPRSSASSGYLSCGLEPVLKYDGVKALQRSLRYCHGQNIAIDGSYGSATKEAVKNAQRWYNANFSPDIAVDGYYGPDTLLAMKWYGYGAGRYVCQRAQLAGGA